MIVGDRISGRYVVDKYKELLEEKGDYVRAITTLRAGRGMADVKQDSRPSVQTLYDVYQKLCEELDKLLDTNLEVKYNG